MQNNNFNINDDDFIDIIMLGTVFGIIGARAYYVAFAPFEYETLWDMINLRDGGIGIYGGLIAGLVSGWFLCKCKNTRHVDMLILTNVSIGINNKFK